MSNHEMELDVVGQYYASINNAKQSGVFAISVYLKEAVNPEMLQQASEDLMRRLPFMNGRVKDGFFHYKFEVLETFAKVMSADSEPLFTDYYSRGSRHMIRIVYSERHFTVKTTHCICDGRGLSRFVAALIVRYFELQGVNVDKGHIIDCADRFKTEEAEDACKRFKNKPPKKNEKIPKRNDKIPKKNDKIPEKNDKKSQIKGKAYRTKYSKSSPQHILTKSFDVRKIKAVARFHDVTISEFILAHIFIALAKERREAGGKGEITAGVPIDCRSFFPSETLRSFVGSEIIVMPKEDDFSTMVNEIKEQFAKITKESVYEQIYEYQSLYQKVRFVPRVIMARLMKVMTSLEANEITTGFSNLGLIKLPEEIERRIERLEFPIALEQESPHYFSCVTVGNTLALTATFREEGRAMVECVMGSLEKTLP